MKKQFLLILVLVFLARITSAQTQVDLPVDFDNASVNYDLVDFGGNASMIMGDPTGGTNQVCMVVKSNTAQLWAGTTIGGSGLLTAIPFAPGATTITMRVYSPDSGIVVRLKAEDPNDPTHSVETDAVTTTSNTWENLTFDFTNQAAGTAAINYSYTFQKLSAFFNFGVDGATAGTKTYYFDDIIFVPGPPAPVNITFQVQNPDSTPVFVFGSWSGWSNWPGTLMTPVGSGIYTATIALDPGSSYEYLFVNGGTTPTKETLDPSWPCTNGNAQYTNRTLTTGTSDVTLCSVWASCSTCNTIVLSQVDLPISFDDQNVNYALGDFGGNNSAIEPDPAGGTNLVLRAEKSNTAQLWAGTTIGVQGLANTIPFASNATRISMRVYSPDAGIVVRMKTEDANNPAISVETDAVTTTSNAWETLTFDFANQAAGTAAINFSNVYNKLSVFFNFGIDGATAGTKTYYCDDVVFLPALPSLVNITFQVQHPDSTPVYVFGSWNGWSNYPGTPMTLIGNDIYSATIQIPGSANYEFKYVNGSTPVLETLDPSWSCTNGNAQYTNRTLAAGTSDVTLCSVWSSCNACNTVVVSQVDLPVTFDDLNVNYDLGDFGGNNSAIEPDPAGGTNQVLRAEKSNTAQLWAGTTIGVQGLANPIPFASNATRMSMRVYSPDAGIVVRMKAEDVNNPAISVETDAITTTSNAWETLTFDFANQAAGTASINYSNVYRKLSVFFNFGVDGATAGTKTYYCDDVQFLPPGPVSVNVTFQVQHPDSTPVYVFGSWSGWSNYPGTPMTFVGNDTYSATVQMQGASNYEFLFVNGSTPVKEVLDPSWSCTNGNTQYTNRTLALGSSDTTLCAIWDSCTTCSSVVLTQVDLPVTFDDASVNYALTDFGGNTSNIEPDPAGGTNLVAKAIKSNTAQLWAGTTIGGAPGFAHSIPFAPGSTIMRMRVYSPDAGIAVRMKAEDPLNPAISVETDVITTTSNAWETLTFDFSNQAIGTAPINFSNNYQKLSVFFNFGVDGATAGTKTYYFDDVEFGGGVPAVINFTFQVESPDSLPVYVFGSWSGWGNYPGTLMVASSGNPGKYETTIPLNANSAYEFLFVNGGTPVKEVLDPSWSCTNGNAQYTNRTLFTGNSDSSYCSIWSSCMACTMVSVGELEKEKFSVVVQQGGIRVASEKSMPIRSVEVYDMLGKKMAVGHSDLMTNTLIPVEFATSSMYVIRITTDSGIAVYKGFVGN